MHKNNVSITTRKAHSKIPKQIVDGRQIKYAEDDLAILKCLSNIECLLGSDAAIDKCSVSSQLDCLQTTTDQHLTLHSVSGLASKLCDGSMAKRN